MSRKDDASRGTRRRLGQFLLLLLWVYLVLYPLPWLLPVSVARILAPPVAVLAPPQAELFRDLPTAREIEQEVYRLLPYRYDWEVHRVPWYFPTLPEVLEKGQGDCKARFLLLASVLETRQIPYEIRVSPTHIWVDYEGKTESPYENPGVTMLWTDGEGQRRLQRPEVDWGESWQSFRAGFWDVMPGERKVLLLAGFPVVYGIPWWRKARPRGTARMARGRRGKKPDHGRYNM